MKSFFEKYESLIVFMLGFCIGVFFICKLGGEYSRGDCDGYKKAVTQWNGMIVDGGKGKR